MGSEIAAIQAASPMVAAVLNATTSVITQLRLGGTASAALRQEMKDRVETLRASKVSSAITQLGMQNMQHTFDLYDLAATREGLPGYADALAEAAHAVRLLRDNLDNLARRLG